MKRVAATMAAAVLSLGGIVAVAPSAQADDTPGCVTYSEFQRIGGRALGLPPYEVRRIFGTAGQLIYDTYGGNRDIVRSYKKCRGFDGGRGRVGINFDNYSHSNSIGLRLFQKARMSPYNLAII